MLVVSINNDRTTGKSVSLSEVDLGGEHCSEVDLRGEHCSAVDLREEHCSEVDLRGEHCSRVLACTTIMVISSGTSVCIYI